MKLTLQPAKQSRGLIRSLERQGVRDDKAPRVVHKTPPIHEPTLCARCGAVFLRKTWRHDRTLTDKQIEHGLWGFCPACEQVSRQEGQGRLLLRGLTPATRVTVLARIENAAARAMSAQPERRIVSMETIDGGNGVEVLTTSQKLTHRLVHEVKKLLRGRVSYSWSDDGTLLATWYPSEESNKRRASR
jgi:NMD protein affecting ribosome stability and mRNA decay